jgi:hypothetical protein
MTKRNNIGLLKNNNYYNLSIMFSILWSITSLLAFDIHTYSLSINSKYFFTFFSGTVTEFLKTDNSHLYRFYFSLKKSPTTKEAFLM